MIRNRVERGGVAEASRAPLGRCRAGGALVAAAIAIAATTACGSHYRSSYSLNDAHPQAPSLLVAQKIERPLYLVLDPERVRDAWDLKGSGGAFQLKDFQQFVTRDLKQSLSPYFSRVEVVRAGDPMPTTPHVVGDVKVDRVQLHDLSTGRLTYTAIEMTWSFALRPNENADYVFSFGGTAASSDSYPTFEVGCAQMEEHAISAMLAKWTEKGGIEALRHTK